jgi:hypothetical protein
VRALSWSSKRYSNGQAALPPTLQHVVIGGATFRRRVFHVGVSGPDRAGSSINKLMPLQPHWPGARTIGLQLPGQVCQLVWGFGWNLYRPRFFPSSPLLQLRRRAVNRGFFSYEFVRRCLHCSFVAGVRVHGVRDDGGGAAGVHGSDERRGGAAVEQALQHLHALLPAGRRRHALQRARRRRNGRPLRLVRTRALPPPPFILQLIGHTVRQAQSSWCVWQRQVLSRVSKSDRDVTASGCDLIRLVTLVVLLVLSFVVQ